MNERNEAVINELQNIVLETLPKKRHNHVLGVAYMSADLAICYQMDPYKAMMAGLLHDIAKYIPGEKAVNECLAAGLHVSELEKRQPHLLHGKLGAYYCKTLYGIKDQEILNAITFHTTGRPEMSMLEEIVFLADYIEIHRAQETAPSLAVIRETAFHKLQKAVYYALDNTLVYLKNTKMEIDSMTNLAYEYYKEFKNL